MLSFLLKILSVRVASHNMLRTKCFNLYVVILGKHFQIGLYREFLGDINGQYLGTRVRFHVPVKPFRMGFSVPSVYTIKDALMYAASIAGRCSPTKTIRYSYSRMTYTLRN